jgi:hypothetical protein
MPLWLHKYEILIDRITTSDATRSVGSTATLEEEKSSSSERHLSSGAGRFQARFCKFAASTQS